jgi:acetoin utilization deacetylase AcuC-like enzyme
MADLPRRPHVPESGRPSVPVASDPGETRQTHDPQSVTLFYSPVYWAEAPDFDTFRKTHWIERRLAAGAGQARDFIRLEEPDDLHDVELEAVHMAAYLAAIETGEPRALAASNGLEWTPALYAAAACSSQGLAQAAVRALLRGGVAGSLSAGLHHARAGRGVGFCTFNGLALAGRAALEAGAASVLILDLDAHFGGGTWSIVSAWDGVWHADVSVADFDTYDPAGHPRSMLERVRSSTEYLDVIQRVLDGLSSTTFDLVIYNAGMDPFERCAVGGLFGITKTMLDLREQLVFDWARAQAIPVAFALAGGYTGPAVSRDELVDLHLLTIDASNPARPALTPPRRVGPRSPIGSP